MALKFLTEPSMRRARPVMRRATAIIASLAVLFQALVFAWHQHELPFASRGGPVLAHAAAGSGMPASADRDCPICFAIAHHGAVPVAFYMPSLPDERALQQHPAATLGNLRTPYFLFRSRAPPRV